MLLVQCSLKSRLVVRNNLSGRNGGKAVERRGERGAGEKRGGGSMEKKRKNPLSLLFRVIVLLSFMYNIHILHTRCM